MFRRVRIVAVGGLLVMAMAGCVRTEEAREPLSKTALMISRDASGTTLQWKSRKGERYTILYRDGKSPNARWQPLPQATEVEGNGGMLVVRDNTPGAFYRSYRPQALIAVSPDKIPRNRRTFP